MDTDILALINSVDAGLGELKASMPNNREELDAHLAQSRLNSETAGCRINPKNGDLIDNDRKFMTICKDFSREVKAVIYNFNHWAEFEFVQGLVLEAIGIVTDLAAYTEAF